MPFSQVISVPDDHFFEAKEKQNPPFGGNSFPHLAEIRSTIWRNFIPPFDGNCVVKARIAEKITYT